MLRGGTVVQWLPLWHHSKTVTEAKILLGARGFSVQFALVSGSKDINLGDRQTGCFNLL